MFTFFLATFPFENQPPHWLIGVGVAMTVLAFVVLVAVVLRSIWLSVGAFAVDLTVALVLLYWALRESQHSDGKLLLSGFVVELAGLGAVGLAIGARNSAVSLWQVGETAIGTPPT